MYGYYYVLCIGREGITPVFNVLVWSLPWKAEENEEDFSQDNWSLLNRTEMR
jgi:hypothetical protein